MIEEKGHGTHLPFPLCQNPGCPAAIREGTMFEDAVLTGISRKEKSQPVFFKFLEMGLLL